MKRRDLLKWLIMIESKLIYRGQMTGPDHKSSGGGANYQCLPDDPEYDPQAISNVPHSKLRSVFYDGRDLFSPNIDQHQVPCTVCETDRRITKLMIPAKTRCPTSEWVSRRRKLYQRWV